MGRREFITLIGGAAVAWPLAARAQQTRIFRIGFISPASPASMEPRTERFRRGLNELGYVENQNTNIEYRWAEGKEDRLQGLAAEIASKVDVIVAHGVLAALSARHASTSTPIVCFGCGEVISSGLVASLSHPGGNITGQTILAPEASGKRVELLKEAVPGITRLGVLWNSANPVSGPELKETEEAARAGGLELRSISVTKPSEFAQAFNSMSDEHAGAVLVLSDAMFFGNRKQIAELAIAKRLPAVSWSNEFAKSGFMMSYGPDVYELAQRAATYVDKILKGTKPSDLPIEQPTKFEFVVNLKIAKALGLTVPPALLGRADEVIE